MEMSVVVVQLLRLAWIAGTLPIIIVSIPTPKLNSLLGTLSAFASRVFGFLPNLVTEFIVKGKNQIPAAEGLFRHSKQADEYVIPHGDRLEIVSSPHYLSEMVISSSFVVATGGSNLTIWLVFVFVVANLTFAEVETHTYIAGIIRKFEDYPSSRFAFIPFIL